MSEWLRKLLPKRKEYEGKRNRRAKLYNSAIDDCYNALKDRVVRKNIKIICICGSTRFADLHAIKRWEFEKDGKTICLMINYLPMNYAEKMGWNKPDHLGEQAGNKKVLDELHLRKIDLSDEVFIVNVNGYIGESTQKEIEYAKKQGKPISYLEP